VLTGTALTDRILASRVEQQVKHSRQNTAAEPRVSQKHTVKELIFT